MDNLGFKLPDLILESVLRDGFQLLRKTPEHIETILKSLKAPHLEKKYGQTEINKLKTFFSEKEVAVVHSFSEVNAYDLSVSIQLTADVEMENRTGLSDYAGKVTEQLGENQFSGLEPITEQSLVISDNIVPSGFNTNTGALNVMSGDLSKAVTGLQYNDASGVNHEIQGVDPDNSVIYLLEGATVDITNFGQIKSAIESRDFEVKYTREKQSLLLGVHAKNRLTALYLYIIVKYILNAKRKDIHKRGLELPTYTGSDFTRDLSHLADIVHTRFLTVTGQLCETWIDILGPLDQAEIVDVIVKVDKDDCDNEQLGRTESTVQVSEE